jgi:hypothetical protein
MSDNGQFFGILNFSKTRSYSRTIYVNIYVCFWSYLENNSFGTKIVSKKIVEKNGTHSTCQSIFDLSRLETKENHVTCVFRDLCIQQPATVCRTHRKIKEQKQ